MSQSRFHNAPPPASHNQVAQSGFTLVEIAIVMVVIGLLIGGVFGGMSLLRTMRVSATVQEIKTIEAATLTFRDIYRRPPGDLRNPNTRLADCTNLPCSRSGDGDGVIGTRDALWFSGLGGSPSPSAYNSNTENFVFFHHLVAADILELKLQPSMDMAFGVGQPKSKLHPSWGYRITDIRSPTLNQPTSCPALRAPQQGTLFLSAWPTGSMFGTSSSIERAPGMNCAIARSIDVKIDDGRPSIGKMQSILGGSCYVLPFQPCAANQEYANDSTLFGGFSNWGTGGSMFYDISGF